MLYNGLASFAGGLCDGLLAGLSSTNGQHVASIESLCSAVGWQLDSRNGNTYGLDFRNAQGRLKRVSIITGDDPTLLLAARSDAFLAFDEIPPIFPWLAKRNSEIPFCAWQAFSAGQDRVGFMVSYMALAAGLTPAIFKYLVESLARESSEFDAKLEQVGLLHP